MKGLKLLINNIFGYPAHDWESLFLDDASYENMNKEKWQYCANNPYYAYLLYYYWMDTGRFNYIEKAHRIDIACLPHYARASARGILVDLNKYYEMCEIYKQKINQLQSQLNEKAGWEVRTSSVKDIKKLLFEQFNFDPPSDQYRTSSGEISTSKQALETVDDRGTGLLDLIRKIKASRSIYSSIVYSTGPSLSQLPSFMRDSIIPHEGKKFLYLDVKAAECYLLIKWAKCEN